MRSIMVLMLAALVLAAPAPSAFASGKPEGGHGAKPEDKKKDDKKKEGDDGGAGHIVVLQLDPMMAPIRVPDGREASAPVTPFLVLGNDDEVNEICGQVAKFRDILVTALYGNPLPYTAKNTVDFAVAEKPMLPVLRKGLNAPYITAFRMLEGARPNTKNLVPNANVVTCKKRDEKEKDKGEGGEKKGH